ncbi:MAG: hypothetical protein QG614_578 [Patescibacteria group bacterium]|jgi:hypothetical protein|nr:hypothetical protein [Patescibacteria group bacterium]
MTSETILSKFVKVKTELYSRQFQKEKDVSSKGRVLYKYYELSDFLPDVISCLDKNKLLHYFYFKNNNNFSCGTIRIINKDNESDYLEIDSIACNMDNIKEPKDVGAMCTYLKRYTYLTAFDITEDCKMEETIAKKNIEDDLIESINNKLICAGQPPKSKEEINIFVKTKGKSLKWLLANINEKYKDKHRNF